MSGLFLRSDRRELAVLGLVVLAWGLLVAPLTHAWTHARDGHGHSHGVPASASQHGAGSLEHLLVVACAAPATPELTRVGTVLVLAEVARPASPVVESWNSVENITLTRSQFSTDGANGGGLALAPQQTWSGGLSGRHTLGPGVLRGGLRFYGIGDRPASGDGLLKAPGFTQFDLHLGYRHRWFDVALDFENLFNGVYRGAQFATTSRLQGEPTVGGGVPAGFSCGTRGRLSPSMGGSFQGCDDVNYTPAYPFTARLTATVYLD